MFTISPTLLKQCIDMVVNEFDYIYPADGIDENYSILNLGADGVWVVSNLDDSKVQHIHLNSWTAQESIAFPCCVCKANASITKVFCNNQ